MSALSEAVQDYLQMCRALGYQLIEHGRVLPQFVAFLEQRDAPLITTELALEFATQPTHASVVWRHTRLAIVRGFAIYLHALDARHEVPPANLLPATYRRAVPYLYSDVEIDALMRAARELRPALRAVTCETLIGLLSVTGMRISEACGLDRGDVELAARRLTIRRAKNGRSREIPLHPSTVAALERYAQARDELCPDRVDSSAFFLSKTGARLSPQRARQSFDQLRRATGLDRDTLGRHVRIHDIRHYVEFHVSDTPPRCDCCAPNPQSIPQRSRCGSGTKRSTPPTNTCTPTWNSNGGRSIAPHPPTPNPAVTGHPIGCLRSSRASNQPTTMLRSTARSPPIHTPPAPNAT